MFRPLTQRLVTRSAFVFALALHGYAVAQAREWGDASGKYTVNADLVAFNDDTVVLKKENHSLVAVPLEKLSKADQDFLKTKEATAGSGKYQTWTMRGGMKVTGRVVDYARKDVTFQRRRGKIYVNDRMEDNLPEIYRRMLPKIVSHFENIDVPDQKAFEAWMIKQKANARKFTCEGVILELENGDEYGVPFFFFSDDDLKILKPGWDRWMAAAEDKEKRSHEAFMLQAQAEAYQRDRQASQQIAEMQLQMQAYQAGLFDLWEVALYPPQGNYGSPRSVVVPARDSLSASQEALRRNPGFVVGAVGKVQRKY